MCAYEGLSLTRGNAAFARRMLGLKALIRSILRPCEEILQDLFFDLNSDRISALRKTAIAAISGRRRPAPKTPRGGEQLGRAIRGSLLLLLPLILGPARAIAPRTP